MPPAGADAKWLAERGLRWIRGSRGAAAAVKGRLTSRGHERGKALPFSGLRRVNRG